MGPPQALLYCQIKLSTVGKAREDGKGVIKHFTSFLLSLPAASHTHCVSTSAHHDATSQHNRPVNNNNNNNNIKNKTYTYKLCIPDCFKLTVSEVKLGTVGYLPPIYHSLAILLQFIDYLHTRLSVLPNMESKDNSSNLLLISC